MSMNVRDRKAYRTDEKSDGFLTARQRRQIFYVRPRIGDSREQWQLIDGLEYHG